MTDYRKEKIRRAYKAWEKALELTNMFIPSDAWMKPNRAEAANAAWQRMRDEMGIIGCEIAKEMKETD